MRMVWQHSTISLTPAAEVKQLVRDLNKGKKRSKTKQQKCHPHLSKMSAPYNTGLQSCHLPSLAITSLGTGVAAALCVRHVACSSLLSSAGRLATALLIFLSISLHVPPPPHRKTQRSQHLIFILPLLTFCFVKASSIHLSALLPFAPPPRDAISLHTCSSWTSAVPTPNCSISTADIQPSTGSDWLVASLNLQGYSA